MLKEKAHKKHDFGYKASIASTNKSNFIVGAMAHHGRPYDGHICWNRGGFNNHGQWCI